MKLPTVRADELARRLSLERHPENGLFRERHYAAEGDERPASGCIDYYVAPGERTMFHRIDCDEYWVFNAGCDLEVWMIDAHGRVSVERLGLGENARPSVFVRRGVIFASRADADAPDGTLLTCITVPRFDPAAFELFPDEEIRQDYPASAPFWL